MKDVGQAAKGGDSAGTPEFEEVLSRYPSAREFMRRPQCAEWRRARCAMKQVEQRGKRAGQSLVEFALMLPLLLILIANVVNFAGFYYGKRALEHHGVPFEPGLSVYLRAVCEHATIRCAVRAIMPLST